MTAAPNAHSAQLEIGTYRVAAASSTMPMFFLACHTKKGQKTKLDLEQIKEGGRKKREEALLILSSDNQVQCCSEPSVHPFRFRVLRYHSNRHLCIQNGAPSTDRNNFFFRRLERAQAQPGHYELCLVFSKRRCLGLSGGRVASKQMRGAKNPKALTDSNPCPKGPTRRNKRCGKKQKQTSVPWPISRSFLPLPCKLSPSCMWSRQQWPLSFCAGFWTLLFRSVPALVDLTCSRSGMLVFLSRI